MKNEIDRSELPRDKDEHSFMKDQITNGLRKRHKDPFFEKFLDTQMVNNYLFP